MAPLDTKGVYWQAPTTMALAMLCAASLAGGHHWFYARLAGTAVPAGVYDVAGRTVSKQQFNTAVGTALAFLVKASLALAVSVAYIQAFWRAMRTAKEDPTLAKLDCASSAPENLMSLVRVKHWWRHLVLLLLAIIIWCIPIASVITPATLSVQEAASHPPPSSIVPVPNLDFANLNYVKNMYSNGGSGDNGALYFFDGASDSIQNLATSILAQGQILPIEPPALNASWTLSFWGPAMQCHDVQGAKRNATWTNIWNSYNSSTGFTTSFLSWVPWGGFAPDQPFETEEDPNAGFTLRAPFDVDLPFFFVPGSAEPVMSPALLNYYLDSGRPVTINLAVMPDMVPVQLNRDATNYDTWIVLIASSDGTIVTGCFYAMIPTDGNLDMPLDCSIHNLGNVDDDDGVSDYLSGNKSYSPSQAFQHASLLSCELVNTSYLANFTYTNGKQDVQISTNTTGDSPLVSAVPYVRGPAASDVAMTADCNSIDDPPITFGAMTWQPCTLNPEYVRLLSYQGLSSAFNKLLLGQVATSAESSMDGTNTSILATTLAQTDELAFLKNWVVATVDDSPSPATSLQSAVSGSNLSAYLGLSMDRATESRGSLEAVLEEAFQNLTISLLSSVHFQPNYSSPFAPSASTKVTFETWHNIYIYDYSTLWIAYGLSIFLSMLAVSVGTYAMISSGASYDTSFSTIARVSRTAELTVEVTESQGLGQQPLPANLAKARMTMLSSTRLAMSAPSDSVGTAVYKQRSTVESRSLLSSTEDNGVA